MSRSRRGVALVVVLAFLALMMVLVVALFSQSLLQRQISTTSANQTSVELFAQGAINTTIGDIKQEIYSNSTVPAPTPTPFPNGSPAPVIYQPVTFANAVPALQGTVLADNLPNLLKRSIGSAPFAPNVPSRAASGATTTTASTNGHSITPARWNRALLLPLKQPGTTDYTPVDTFSNKVPEWIHVTRAGTNPTTWNSNLVWSSDPTNTNTVIGRYAYTIYNEGGLLDANAAGYPSVVQSPSTSATTPALINQTWYKGALAYADLKQIGLTQTQIDQLVGWRNNATTAASGTSTSAMGYQFPSPAITAANFFSWATQNKGRFLTAANTSVNLTNNATDHLYVNRQQLISFLINNLGSTSDKTTLIAALQYLGTFSRTLNQPSLNPIFPVTHTGANNTNWNHPNVQYDGTVNVPANFPSSPATYNGGNSANQTSSSLPGDNGHDEDIYNPAFRAIRVGTAFVRNDGSLATQGEPLVKKRFPLSRLAWVTPYGPSATLTNSNPVISQDLSNGVTQQTLSAGTADNIQRCFGLTWNAPSNQTGDPSSGLGGYWSYDHQITAVGSSARIIGTLDRVTTQNREPDFFELLKAGVGVGGVSKDVTILSNTTNSYNGVYMLKRNARIDCQILQIGVNIIDNCSPGDYPNTIVFNDGRTPSQAYSFYGVKDLPYLYGMAYMAFIARMPSPLSTIGPGGAAVPVGAFAPVGYDPGLGVEMQIPSVWNPHSQNTSPSATSNPAPSKLRITISNASRASPNIANLTPQAGAAYYPRYQTLTAYTAQSGGTSYPYINETVIRANQWTVNTYSAPKGEVGPAQTGINTAIYFTNSNSLYREPTPLNQAGALSIGSSTSPAIDAQNCMLNPAVASNWTTAGIPEAGSSYKYIGFLCASYPMQWIASGQGPSTGSDGTSYPGWTEAPDPAKKYYYTVNQVGQQQIGYGVTVSLEYQVGATSIWEPYQQYSIDEPFSPNFSPYATGGVSPDYARMPALLAWPSAPQHFSRLGIVQLDPRTGRTGSPGDMNADAFTDTNKTITNTYRYNAGLGTGTHGFNLGGESKDMFVLRAGTPTTDNNGYITDADGVIRRAMGGWVPSTTPTGSATTTIGMPLANVSGNAANAANRPVILHRPYRSVAELGYVFSDTPWKNLDMSSPESTFSSLLDVFCVSDDERTDALAAGKVDLNTRQPLVIQSILSGAYRDEFSPSGASAPNSVPVNNADAATLASALVTRTTGTAVNQGPLVNISDLVGRYIPNWSPTYPAQPYDGFSADLNSSTPANNQVQRMRQAAIRALADSGMAGTWNLMIDVVAQTGRYTPSATSLANFNVEAEHRYWVHVAIDRQTAQVIDEQIEPVNE